METTEADHAFTACCHLLDAENEIDRWRTDDRLTAAERVARRQLNATAAIGFALLDIAQSLRNLSNREPIRKPDLNERYYPPEH
jgi:hypothetical protein